MTENHPTGPKAQVAGTERRKSPRATIRRLAYVNLGPYDNGGVVTDISKDGLRFHMVNPVDQGGLVRVSILLGAANQVDAVGEIVWLDEARKVGGVRFTVLPVGAAEQIVLWASKGPEISKAAPSRGTQATGPAAEHRPEATSAPSTAAVDAPATSVAQTSARSPHEDVGNSFPPEPVRSGVRTPVESTGLLKPERAPWVPPAARASAAIPDRQVSSTQSSELPPAPPTIPQPSATPGPHPILQQPNPMPWITHFDPDPPARDPVFFRGVLGGIAICALLAFVAWFAVRHYGWQNPLASFGDFANAGVSNRDLPTPPAPVDAARGPAATAPSESKPSGPLSAPEPTSPVTNTSATSPQPSPSQPAQTSSPASQPVQQRQAVPAAAPLERPQPAPTAPPNTTTSPANITSSPEAASPNPPPQNQARETALNATPTIAEPSSLSATQYSAPAASAQPLRGVDSGESQLQLARQYLDGRGRPRNATVASQLLWSAVEKGNSAAEMDLADLYLHGDGVARNCDQARVLLSVASQKGNAEATHKLLELNQAGCR